MVSKRDRAFARISGEPRIIIDERPVHFDGRQYSVKLPAKIMRRIYREDARVKVIFNTHNDTIALEYIG